MFEAIETLRSLPPPIVPDFIYRPAYKFNHRPMILNDSWMFNLRQTQEDPVCVETKNEPYYAVVYKNKDGNMRISPCNKVVDCREVPIIDYVEAVKWAKESLHLSHLPIQIVKVVATLGLEEKKS